MSAMAAAQEETPEVCEYEVALVRESMCDLSWEAVLMPSDEPLVLLKPTILFRSTQSPPLPRTIGSIDVMVQCLQSTAPSTPLKFHVMDLNIVRFLSSASRVGVDDEHLQRLSSAIQARGGCVPEAALRRFVDGKSAFSMGHHSGQRRIVAVESGAFYIYPSPGLSSKDFWEVRFLAAGKFFEGYVSVVPSERQPDGAACKYERFQDCGEKEVLRYIDLAVKLGDVERLVPDRLAAEDPAMFWQ
eukprot:3594719-Rhodomonas_salina.1